MLIFTCFFKNYDVLCRSSCSLNKMNVLGDNCNVSLNKSNYIYNQK